MKRHLLALSLLMISILSCTWWGCNKDDDRIRIEGTVTDAAQNIPVAGAEVYLYGKVFQGGIFNPSPSVITMATTDQAGKFNINIEQVKASDFEMVVRRLQYFEFTKALTTNEVAAGKTYKPSYAIHPESWLRLRVQNTNPYDNSDLITYRILSDNPSCSNCCNSNYVQGNGSLYNVETLCRTRALKTLSIVWNVHKGGNHTYDSTSMAMPLFDTLFYHLKY